MLDMPADRFLDRVRRLTAMEGDFRFDLHVLSPLAPQE